jgi:hypothetical protein
MRNTRLHATLVEEKHAEVKSTKKSSPTTVSLGSYRRD